MPRTSPHANEADFHGESNAVKGEFPWSRQSSTQSMSPEIDINSLLTQIDHAPRNLESPEPLEQETSSPQGVPESTISRIEITSANSFPRSRHRHSSGNTMEERLVMMPEKRALPWREGVGPGAENETGGESRRKQIRFGCLLATRGEVQAVPCNSCANGRGKFNVCVSLPGFFKGACASCQLSGRPNRCSIKKGDVYKSSSNRLDSPSSPNTNRALGTSRTEEKSNFGLQPVESEGMNAKRQKTSAVALKASSEIPQWHSTRPPWEQELGNSGRQEQSMGQRDWATVNPQPETPTATQGLVNEMNGMSNEPYSALGNQENSLNWSSVNQPSQPPPMPLSSGPVSSLTSTTCTSTTPNTKITSEKNNGIGFHPDTSLKKSKITAHDEVNSMALIDTLPKGKQRQVYGLVSGIQGGLDHLQRELNSLKRALGIDDED